MPPHKLNDLKLEFIVIVRDNGTYLYKRVHWAKLKLQDIERVTGCIHSFTKPVTVSMITSSYDRVYRKLCLIPHLCDTVNAMKSNRMRDTGQLDILRRSGPHGLNNGEACHPEEEY